MAEKEPSAEPKDEPTRDDKMSAMHDAFGKMCDRMDAMGKRMDAFMAKHAKKDDSAEEENAKKDAKADEDEGGGEGAMDGKKDAEGEGEKEPKKDAKRGDKDFDKWAKEEGEEPEHKDAKRDAKKGDGKEEPEEKPEEMASDDKKDSKADARADNAALLNRIDVLEREARQNRRRAPVSDEELNAIAEAQTEWDRAAQSHGLRASRPMDGETLEGYERRHAKRFQQHSKNWAKVDLSALPSEVLAIALPEIRADARRAAENGGDMPNAVLREIRTPDRTGRIISEFVGPVAATLAPFRMPVMRVKRINNNPGQQF
jgi:hypothetical protein